MRKNMNEVELYRPTAATFCNRRIKINPLTGDVMEDVTFNRDIFNPEGLVSESERKARKTVKGETNGEGAVRAARRAKKQVFELCACNDFDLFFTLTLNKELIDRYDYKAAVRKFGQWADNHVRRAGLKYVAVPELHKDGAIHFHGLCNSAGAGRLVDSGKKSRGQTVYNLPSWRLGYTTAIPLYGERGAAAHYVAKYVTKQQGGGTIGGRYYYHGGDLQHARCVYLHADYAAVDAPELAVTCDVTDSSGHVMQAGLRCKYMPV